jgi:hypothetical protein
MSPGAVRIAVAVVCVVGIAGMIVGSIADNNGVAITFGLVMAAATLCLIAVTAVTGSDKVGDPGTITDEEAAEAIEHQVRALVDAGAEEESLRALVGDAIRLGRTARPRRPSRG